MSQLEIRSLLAAVGFRDEDVFVDAQGLSGGELARLNLARISLEHPNLLVLDEPTNHLDIYTKDVLCEALRDYDGTMIVVTHDRYLMEQLNGRVLLLENGRGLLFPSMEKYKEYKETGVLPAQGDEPAERPDPKKAEREAAVESVKAVINNQKELRRQRAIERERRSFVEKRMEELEGEIYDLNAQLELPEVSTDHEQLAEVCAALEKYKAELSELEDEWLENYAEE